MSLRNILLLVKNCQQTANFYKAVVKDINIIHETPTFIEMNTAKPSVPIIIKEATVASQLAVGYSPFLTFEVTDMDQSITQALSNGGMLDGPIRYPAQGKVPSSLSLILLCSIVVMIY